MRKLLLSGLTVTALSVLYALPAHAQATRTWVSGVGDDVNPCSRTAPCKTFAGAISKTAAGGEISVLDPGGFGAVTITKSISITNDGAGEAGVLASAVNGIVVSAGASDVVNIRGLVIDGAGTTLGLNGIRFLAGKTVNVSNCVIKNFSNAGIQVATAASSRLAVRDTLISNSGTGSAGGGVFIQPTGGSVSATFTRVTFDSNSNGLNADASSTTGVVLAAVTESNASANNFTGFALKGGTGLNTTMVLDQAGSFNNSTGISSTGGNANVVVSRTSVMGNDTGLSSVSSGAITSVLSNAFLRNGVNGAPTATQTPQ